MGSRWRWFGFMVAALAVTTVAAGPAPAAPPRLPIVPAAEANMSADGLAQIDAIVARGLANKQMPGCVVLVGHRGKIAWLKAYGEKTAGQAMTTDTLFDLASLTKPIATATAVMKLLEDERIALADPVAKHLPEFGVNGKENITIEHLLTHQGGLIADNALADYRDGIDKAWERLFALRPVAPAGERFIYSDVGFEILGKLVERHSEQTLHAFTQAKVFQPLGMTATGFLPEAPLRARAAPTQQREGRAMLGEVHDPRAYLLGGVAGHAGLFSTAEDLAIYAQMLISGGQYEGVRILEAATVETMFRPVKVPGNSLRALGWDVRSGFSSNRGEGLSPRSVGHGGFTGTVIWLDPEGELFYIFLSNRVHPDGSGNVNRLAGEIGTAAVQSIER